MRSKQSRSGIRVKTLLAFGHLNLLRASQTPNGYKINRGGNVQNVTSFNGDIQQNQVKEPERMEASDEFQEYSILSSAKIFKRLKSMEKIYPNFVTLQSSQQLYGLQGAGGKDDCEFDHDVSFTDGCKNYILTIEDHAAHPNGSESWKRLPEVFLSGALHGNERVGPTAVVETANLLLEAASCEAKPHGMEPKVDDESRSKWLLSKEEGHACRKELYRIGIDDASRKWLARLVTTRRIVIMPTPNALGYYRNHRTELDIDPNRDFPFDLADSSQCMQTIAGRSINEVFRDHIFQLSLTFHAGMEVIAYEWGAPTYSDSLSPDHAAQKEISAGYSRFAGKFGRTPPYLTGTMNEEVYPVRGGMEDWAYAGSWDPDRVIECQPVTFDGYPAEKTVYNDSTLRAVNMLVEASNDKTPRSGLGTSQQLFNNVDDRGNGHIARNIRLSLIATDLVQPYVTIVGVNGIFLTDDISPGTDSSKFEKANKAVAIPKGQNNTVLKWTVGGGFTVDYTTILHSKWDNVDAQKIREGDLRGFTYAPATTGKTHWHADGADPPPNFGADENGFAAAMGPTFSITIDTSKYHVGDTIVVFAMARVDQGWYMTVDGVSPNLPPTSHIVNARTNPDWSHESAQKIIQGRTEWFSIPLTLIISEDEEGTKDLSNRLESLEGLPDYWGLTNDGKSEQENVLWSLVIPIAVASLLIIGLLFAAKWVMSRHRRQILQKQSDEEGDFMYDDDGIQLQKHAFI
mmetsp:Transcript_24976/g.29433  ORF Transcript_24976/g.29433 Transcript_24976/m.29433 type:complete len:742 (+) Transcript_24976:134-2359(+)